MKKYILRNTGITPIGILSMKSKFVKRNRVKVVPLSSKCLELSLIDEFFESVSVKSPCLREEIFLEECFYLERQDVYHVVDN